MTRTERSQSIRALARDRSGSRNGMDSSLPKGGAGAHNWGSLEFERRYEDDGLDDEAADFEDQAKETGCEFGHVPLLYFTCLYGAISAPAPKKPAAVRRTSSVTDEDRENALKVRQNALKNNDSMSSYPYSVI
jgi:hypothetical protein